MMGRGFGGVHGGVSNPRQSTISMVRGIPLVTEHVRNVHNLIMAERSNVGGESLMRTRAVSKRSQNEEKCFWPR